MPVAFPGFADAYGLARSEAYDACLFQSEIVWHFVSINAFSKERGVGMAEGHTPYEMTIPWNDFELNQIGQASCLSTKLFIWGLEILTLQSLQRKLCILTQWYQRLNDHVVLLWVKTANHSMDDMQIWKYLKTQFTVVLDKLEHLPGAMMFLELIRPPVQSLTEKRQLSGENCRTLTSIKLRPSFAIKSLRLIELSNHASAVMRASTSTCC